MKIAILTQPLLNNYGCLLQNYALQKVLESLGHQPKTIDYLKIVISSLGVYLKSWLKSFVLFFIPSKRRKFAKYSSVGQRKDFFEIFVTRWIKKTKSILSLDSDFIKTEIFDAIIVGSDQVWRPRFVNGLENYYLKFAKNLPIKRIAYAASFGVDNWEYSAKQTKVCSALAKKFDAISVREESGVKLCKDHLGVDATWVLDPTLLLKKEDYLDLCSDVPKETRGFLAVYMLDVNDVIKSFCETEAQKRGFVIKYFSADSKSTLSVPEWLAMFRDASYVVTDSFHGTVFSIIFEKEFKCFYNENRGAARFESLLNLYNTGKLEEMREFSINWLKNALES